MAVNVSLPSVLEPCEMFSKLTCEIRRIAPGGASGAFLENYENMFASTGLSLFGENMFYKSVSK